jgi:rhodanese-related sulfurtransferase/glutaredoxin
MKKKIIAAAVVLFITASIFAQPAKEDGLVTLSLDSFTAKIGRQQRPQIVDARSPEEFAFNHIENALNFNVQTAGYEEYVKALDKTRPVFIYAINTGRSSVLAHDLKKKGFAAAYDLEGGIANWIGSGRPYLSSVKKGVTLTEYNRIIASGETVLVDIGSRYCPQCKKVKPVLDSIRNEYPAGVKILEIELEENPQLIAALKTVNVFPYFILYNKGAIVYKRSGLNALKADLDQALAKLK